MRDNLHLTILAHDCILSKTKDIDTFRKIVNVEISTIKVGSHTWFKQNICIFTLNICYMLCTF